MENLILVLGTDCTLFHGFKDYFKYTHLEDDVPTSPFAGTWIYDPSNKPGDWKINYGSLGIVADLIETNFGGWSDLKKDFRGRFSMKKYPVEFTHYKKGSENRLNRKSPELFYKKLRGNVPILFCSVWRVYINFRPKNEKQVKADIFKGLEKFKKAMFSINPELKYRMAFFFVVNKTGDKAQEDFVHRVMSGSNIKYGILYNEVDKKNNSWRSYRMRFDCTGWEQALVDAGVV